MTENKLIKEENMELSEKIGNSNEEERTEETADMNELTAGTETETDEAAYVPEEVYKERPQLVLRDLVKIYPFTEIRGIMFGKKKAKQWLEKQKQMPYTTNEGVIAVQHFSMEIKKGEFIVLLGPSGCGKSTLLKMIAGLTDLSSGDVLLDGRLINDVYPEDRNFAMVFQNYSLYPHLNVYKNLAYPLRNLHLPEEELDRKVQDIAKLLKLQKLLDRRPKELSGGEMQRVAIGRALVREPVIFLMDEPLSNLDASFRQKLRTEIRRIHDDLHNTVIYVTHDQREAFMLADRIVVMKDGLIQQIGTPKELYNHPVNSYVASFIGEPKVNLLPGELQIRVSGSGLKASVSVLDTELSLPEDTAALFTKADDHRKVTVGIRPVHIKKTEDGGGIAAKVTYKEVLGSEVNLGLEVNGTEIVTVIPLSLPKDAFYMPGDEVHIVLPGDKLFLFDEQTGMLIE